MEIQFLQAIIFLATPAFAIWSAGRSKIADALSPVAICYLIGIALANQPWIAVSKELSENVGGVGVILAIPMLLFTVDIPAWFRAAGVTVRASLICFFSVFVVSYSFGKFFAAQVPDAFPIAGALAAVYAGGTPSMFAVAKAIEMPAATLVMTNLCDMVTGGLFYFLLISGGYRVYLALLKDPERPIQEFTQEAAEEVIPRLDLFKGLGLGAVIAGISVGIGQLCPPSWQTIVTILSVSTLGIAASFNKRIRTLPGTYSVGEYTLLVFCVSIGSLADLAQLGQTDMGVLAMVLAILSGSLLLEMLLFRLFRVDSHTALMAMTATIYSPPFVPPVAGRLKDKDALVTGITVGLMGYAVATYLGIAVTAILKTVG